MRAAVLEELHQPLQVWDVEVADPGPEEVMVRILASGVCHTDYHVREGHQPTKLPVVLGHEGAGIVEKVGAGVRGFRPGDTVITVGGPACTRCWYCVHGQPINCERMGEIANRQNFIAPDGSRVFAKGGLGTFSGLITVHEASIVRVETDLPMTQLSLIGCAVATGVGAVLANAKVVPGSSVVVVGGGGVGQSVIQGARVAGATNIIVVDPVAMKREQALANGAQHAIDPTADDVVEVVAGLTSGRGADYAFEVVGGGKTLMTAWECTRQGGTTVCVGLAPPEDQFSVPASEILMSRKHLIGSIGSGDTRASFPMIVQLAESGLINLEYFVTRTIGIDDVNAAFDDMLRGEVVRSVIEFG